jgi:hypothetical protein
MGAKRLHATGQRCLECGGGLDDEHADDQREQLHRTGIIGAAPPPSVSEILVSIIFFVAFGIG